MLQAHHTTKINVFPVETSFKQATHTQATHTHTHDECCSNHWCLSFGVFLLVLTYYYYYNNYDVNIYNDNNKVTNKTRQEKRYVYVSD